MLHPELMSDPVTSFNTFSFSMIAVSTGGFSLQIIRKFNPILILNVLGYNILRNNNSAHFCQCEEKMMFNVAKSF